MPKTKSRGDTDETVVTMPKSKSRDDTDETVVLNKDSLAMTVVEILKDASILKRMKEVIFPSNLTDAIATLTDKVERLTNELCKKDVMIQKLEQRVEKLEEAADNTEQYSRRPNLRVHGIAEQADENTDQLIVKSVNDQMQFQPPIQPNQIERSHRLGPKTSADGTKGERAIIVRFRSERVRDEVYRSRFKLKTIQPDKRVFINEDLTARRAGLARQTRALKKEHKVNDCWTAGGNVMLKDLQNRIRHVKSTADLAPFSV